MAEKPPTHNNGGGFTIIEVLVTTIIVALFSTVFFQSYMLIESQRITVVRHARAGDVALSNLHKVTNRTGITIANCPALTSSSGFDLFSIGYTRETVANTPIRDATQTLRAYATTNDCVTDFTQQPLKIVSTVEYTVNGNTTRAVYASYIKN